MSGRGKLTSGHRERRHPGDRSDNRDMHHDPTRSPTERGFTLIELMIVVAVMAVIALVAVPSYMDSVRKSRRADAMTGLTKLQQLQERYRGEKPTYASAVASMPLSWGPSNQSPEGHYDLTISNADAVGYTVTATAKSGSPQYGDTKCRSISVKMLNGSIGTSSTNSAGDVDTGNANRCWAR
jgi:type IV pilus assembly protein PilE